LKDIFFVLDSQDIIQSVIPSTSIYASYKFQPFIFIFSPQGKDQYLELKKLLISNEVVLNYPIECNNFAIGYINAYMDKSMCFIMILSENTSEEELFKKIMVLNSQQLNELRALHKQYQLQDTSAYEEISKLNNELLNSKRIIDKQNAELLKFNKLLKQMSIEDSLTGCFNRRQFYAYMRETVLPSQSDEVHTLVMIDFNHFKDVNDQFGHDAGDRLLVRFVQIARDILQSNGEVFRLGGDEFILLTNQSMRSEVEDMMEKINQLFIKNSTVASIAYGIIQYKACDVNQEFDLTNLIRKSDQLMYQNKQLFKESKSIKK
jgi:diguanylate cyclase (GGDEF)-like protein